MGGKAVGNSSEKQKHKNHDMVDMISTLPDSIIGVILSFLPTQEAVATAILSRRWRSLWTTVHNFNFYRNSLRQKRWNNDVKFVQFVNTCLLLHDGGPLNKFQLKWIFCSTPSYVAPWITTAITRNVPELSLCLRYIRRPFEVPISVFRCASLRSLELEMKHSIDNSVVGCLLPRLESLKLFSVSFRSEEVFEKLISRCPVLNHLHLNLFCASMHRFTFIISSTSLRRLELVNIPHCSIKLEASSLEYLKLHGRMPKFFVLKSLNSLDEVDLGIDLTEDNFSEAGIYNSVVELVHAFDCTKSLTLSASITQALSRALRRGKINLSIDFKRLVELETRKYYCDYSSILELLQSSDNLQVLMISQEIRRWLDESSRLKWETPVKVPRCLSNSLRKVVLNGHEVKVEDEREMIHYMLKHGSALEVMQITFSRVIKGPTIELVKEICEYPRKSPSCEIEFLVQTSNGKVEVCYTAWPLKKVSN